MTVIDALPISSCFTTAPGRGDWHLSNGASRGAATGHSRHGRLSRCAGNQATLSCLGRESGITTSARSASRNTTRKLCDRTRAERGETFATNEKRGNTIQMFCCPTSPQSPKRIGQFRVLCLRSTALEVVSYLRHCSTNEFRQRSSNRRLQGGKTWSVRALQDDSNYAREETRWLREEQRWLREEQRWQAQEIRLAAENDALRDDVATLRKELAELRRQRESGDLVADSSLKSLALGLRGLLESLAPSAAKTPALEDLGEVPSIASLPESVATFNSVKNLESEPDLVTTSLTPEKVVAVVRPTPDGSAAVTPVKVSSTSAVPVSSLLTNETLSNSLAGRKRRTLKPGMEGDDVKELQDTLAQLGFYSGEEDMEYSVFSIGTSSAVKTWQATAEISQDGTVTEELMRAMLAETVAKVPNGDDELPKPKKTDPKPSKVEISRPIKSQPSSDPKVSEIKYERTFAQETGEGPSRRVYLLGENRWEEPDRVSRKQDGERFVNNGATSVTHAESCFACRGLGTVLCTDCEGTGEINIEEQFLEWTDEGAHCPYCDGLGAVVCDICNGAAVVAKT